MTAKILSSTLPEAHPVTGLGDRVTPMISKLLELERNTMIGALTTLLLFQLIGEVIVRTLALPLPGPVLGMLLLFFALLLRGSIPQSLTTTSEGILQHLSLLFVPAGVGVMVHRATLQAEWLATLITIASSTLITIVVTAFSMRFLLRLTRRSSSAQEE